MLLLMQALLKDVLHCLNSYTVSMSVTNCTVLSFVIKHSHQEQHSQSDYSCYCHSLPCSSSSRSFDMTL